CARTRAGSSRASAPTRASWLSSTARRSKILAPRLRTGAFRVYYRGVVQVNGAGGLSLAFSPTSDRYLRFRLFPRPANAPRACDMHRVEEQIMMYSVLVPEERQVLDAYVVDHPELVPLLEEAKSWTALFQEARMLRDAEPGDEALAYLVVTRRMSRHPLPRRLEQTFRALESRVAAQ